MSGNISKPKKGKAYFLIALVIFIAFSAVTRCSYVPHHFKTGYVNMNLPEDMSGPKRGFYFSVALFNQLKVMTLMTYMDVYEFLFLDSKPYIPTTKPAIFVINSKNTAIWSSKIKRYYDWDGDGFVEATAWPPAGSQVLFFDKNDGQEPDFLKTNSAMTWAVLHDLDNNKDGRLTKDDPSFSNLRISGTKFDMKPDDRDIHLFADLYSAINLKEAKLIRLDGKTEPIELVNLYENKVNSFYTRPVKLNPSVYRLPTIRGYGYIPYLHIAMSLDNELLEKVSAFKKCNIIDVFANPEESNAALRDIMFRWAGVDGIDPKSRGPFIDARELAYLEKITTQDFLQIRKWSNPRPYAAKDLRQAWSVVFQNQSARLIFQTCGRSLFHKNARYNPMYDSFSPGSGLNQQVISSLLQASKRLPKQEQKNFEFGLRNYLTVLPQKMPLQDQMFIMMQQ